MMRLRLTVVAIGLISACASRGWSQTALNGNCFTVENTTSGLNLVLKASCWPTAYYLAVVTPADSKALEKKLDDTKGDAVDAIKKAVDAQAIKADDIARVVNATREDVIKQLQPVIDKAVKDTLTRELKTQVASQVATQLKKNTAGE
jgi:hypothetical protein